MSNSFVGISLSGGMVERTAVAVIEAFPEHDRVFLVKIHTHFKTEGKISSDTKLSELLKSYQSKATHYIFDVPLTLPKCMRCDLVCPGFETCSEPEIVWMRQWAYRKNKKRNPQKMFTPYTQRCLDAFLATELDVSFDIQHALGANVAPLAARARFVTRRLGMVALECSPKVVVWRVGSTLKIPKSQLKFHKHSVGGEESRKNFLSSLSEKRGIFFYQQDFRLLVEKPHCFDAFICAYAGFLESKGMNEKRPMGYPPSEAWSLVPGKLTP